MGQAPGSLPEPPTCCGEPKRWVKDSRYTIGGWWRCRVEDSARRRAAYAELDGVNYNRLLLRHRRTKALARIRGREASRG